jgi:hypothetical protein
VLVNDPTETSTTTTGPASGKLLPKGIDFIRLDGVQPEKVRWVWPNRFPRGKFSIIAGAQGKGKSFLSLYMAACISTGGPWPDCETWRNAVETVVVLSAEDDPADTIRPRFDALQGDPSRVIVVRGTHSGAFNRTDPFDLKTDLRDLEQLIVANQPVGMVIIDPINAYLPSGTNANSDAEVREVLHPLGELAAKLDIAIIGITHLRKGGDVMDALHRVMGSNAFTAYARAVWFVTVDREDPDCRLLLPGKLSVGKPAPGLKFRIDAPGVIEWLGENETAADEAMAPSRPQNAVGPAVQQAMEFLTNELAAGPKLAAEVKAAAKVQRVSGGTLERARKKLGVVPFREVVRPGEPYWWRLTDESPEVDQPAESPDEPA